MRADAHLEPGCPWWSLSELRVPNVDWCETQQCSWVVEPANTYSNLAYILVGLVLYVLVRRCSSDHLRAFAPAAITVGVASGIYHASYTFVLQILDFVGMYVFLGLLLTLTARRAGWLSAENWRRYFVQGVVGLTGFTVALDFLEVPIQAIVFLMMLVVVVGEVRLQRSATDTSLASLGVAVALLTAAGAFSFLDVTRTWCLPDHPFLQGHAIWHVLSATSLLACFHYYRQFEDQLAGTA